MLSASELNVFVEDGQDPKSKAFPTENATFLIYFLQKA